MWSCVVGLAVLAGQLSGWLSGSLVGFTMVLNAQMRPGTWAGGLLAALLVPAGE
jgi:hypothetical protein